MPIFLFALAGAMLFGGVGVFSFAQQESARDEARRRQDFEADLLAGAIKLEDLRDEARRRGIDPDAVVSGYQALRDGLITIDDLLDLVRKLS